MQDLSKTMTRGRGTRKITKYIRNSIKSKPQMYSDFQNGFSNSIKHDFIKSDSTVLIVMALYDKH